MGPKETDATSHPDSESTSLISPVEPKESSSNSTDDLSIHTRTKENTTKVWLWALTPLVLHLLSALILAAILNFRIDKHDFNLQSRRALTNFTPLQSDVTTAVSGGVTIMRLFMAMWSAPMILRCIFILLEKDGISLQQIDSLLTWQLHFLPHVNSSRKIGLLVSIVLLLSFPCQLSGPIVTGSISWSSSSGLIQGGKVTNITSGPISDEYDRLDEYGYSLNLSKWSYTRDVVSQAYGYALTAWQGSRGYQRTMKRVLTPTSELPVNSVLNNVTLPYFAISKLEWIKDPIHELSPVILKSLTTKSEWNPFYLRYYSPGTFAIIPDSWDVASPPQSRSLYHTETRYIVGVSYIELNDLPFGELPANIGEYKPNDYIRYIFGRITYVAGVAECRKCRISSWRTVENDTELTVLTDAVTTYAMALMPVVGHLMTSQNCSLPGSYNNLDHYVAELFIRSYGASWTALKSTMQNSAEDFLETDVQIAVPTSRANIQRWRVFLWLSLNLMFTVSGVLFVIIQRTCNQPLIGNPFMAALLLDTTEVQHKGDHALCNFSTFVADDNDVGYLYLQNTNDGTHKRVEVLER